MWTHPVIEPLGQSRSDADIIFDLAKRIVPDDGLMQKGYETAVDWILKPSGLTVSELKNHPAGLDLNHLKKPPFANTRRPVFRRPRARWSSCPLC